jgi:hypothetical protein
MAAVTPRRRPLNEQSPGQRPSSPVESGLRRLQVLGLGRGGGSSSSSAGRAGGRRRAKVQPSSYRFLAFSRKTHNGHDDHSHDDLAAASVPILRLT